VNADVFDDVRRRVAERLLDLSGWVGIAEVEGELYEVHDGVSCPNGLSFRLLVDRRRRAVTADEPLAAACRPA